MVATTLTVVSCLHRHASLDSMREVETVQPLAPPPSFRQDFPSYAAFNQRQRNYLPDQITKFKRSTSRPATSSSPPSSTSWLRTGHSGRPPASLVNCSVSTRIDTVGCSSP